MVTSITPIIQQYTPRAQVRVGDRRAYVTLEPDAYMDSTTSATQLVMQTHASPNVAITNGTESYHRNQQYSITAVTTSTGSIAERYAYTAYGQPTILDASASVLSSSAINNRYTYTGREWDATLGLHHFRARWMNPSAGRFVGRDSIGYRDSFNLQQYVGQFVLSGMDPSGNLRQRKIRENMKGIKNLEECGKYFLTFEWVLEDHEKEEGGIIIQLVESDKDCKTCPPDGGAGIKFDCNGRSWKELEDPKYTPENKRQCSTYWEMWDVPKGGGGNQATPLQDIFADPGCVGQTTGTSRKKGTAIFISDSQLNDGARAKLRRFFKTGQNGAASAHSLPSVCKGDDDFGHFNRLIEELGIPLGYKRSKTAGWIEKSVSVQWNCCDKDRTTQWNGGGIKFTPKNSEAE